MHKFRQGDRAGYEAALGHFEQATNIDPNFGDAFYQSGMCYWSLSVFGLAAEDVTRKASENFFTSMNLAYRPAIPWVELNRRIQLNPRPSQRELASEACEAIKSNNPTWMNFQYIQMAHCLGSAGLFTASLEYHKKYLESHPPFEARAEVEGDCQKLYSSIGRHETALTMLDEMLTTQPDDQSALVERAMLKMRLGLNLEVSQELPTDLNATLAEFLRFYHLFWSDSAAEYAEPLRAIIKSDDSMLRYKYWATFLANDFDRGFQYVQESMDRGAPLFFIQLLLNSALPASIYQKIIADPRFSEINNEHGITPQWRIDLINLCNGLRL